MAPLDITFTPNDAPTEEDPYQTDLEKTTPPVMKDEVIANRAMKYDVALKEQSPGRAWLESTLKAGQDGELRRTTAIAEDIKTLNAKMGIVQEYSQAKGASL